MAAAIWLVRKTGNAPVVDGIVAAIVNADDLGSEATTLAEAHATCIAGGHAIPASGYFTSADLALAAGQLDTDEDAVFFTHRGTTDVIA